MDVLKTDWFDNIENFRPLRGGRRATTLIEVSTSTNQYTIEEAERKFLTDFEQAEKSEDPLEIMWRYTCWFEEHFLSGKQKYFYPILYKICTRYSYFDCYKNDERILKLWIKLAENFPESGLAVMELAFLRSSCRQISKFYIRWSEMYQMIGLVNKAREKLRLGLKMCAMPLQLIHLAIDEFEAQVMRSTLENSNTDDDLVDNPDVTRETLGKLRGLGRKHFAPIVRTTHGSPGVVSKPLTLKRKADDTFNVFIDDVTENSELIEKPEDETRKRMSRIIEEFANDSDYQALFGSFDPKEKFDLDFTNKENVIRLPKIETEFSILEDREINPEYSVYVDTDEKCDKGSAKATRLKPKLILRKELIKSMSLEEAYKRRIEKNTNNDNRITKL